MNNHQAKNKLAFAGRKETKRAPFFMTQLITITPIDYLKIISDANFGTKQKFSLFTHLQKVGFRKTNISKTF